MCLAVPGRIVETRPGEPWAVVDSFGVLLKVGTHLVGEVKTGEYLLVHAGYAIEKIDLLEAGKQIKLLEELLGAGPC